MPDEQMILPKCRCGEKGVFYENKDNPRPQYFIQCKCGRKTKRYQHLDKAISEWKEMNQPAVAKPKYKCGYCDADLYLGFDVCPKCGISIDWGA